MKTQTFIFGLALLFNLAHAQQKENTLLTASFDKILSEQFKSGETGATVLVAQKGKVIYQKAFGMSSLESGTPMKIDHVFKIASLTKQFTAVSGRPGEQIEP